MIRLPTKVVGYQGGENRQSRIRELPTGLISDKTYFEGAGFSYLNLHAVVEATLENVKFYARDFAEY